MALKIKRAFQVDKTTPEAKQLTQLGTDITISAMMIKSAKRELADSMNQRNIILRDMLLDQHDYIVSPSDRVLFMEQTSEIRIYDSNGTIQKEIFKDE